MNKKFLRLGIILALVAVVLALVLSGTPRRSKAASITLQDGQYVRDGWVYGFSPGSGTRGDATSDRARFQYFDSSNISNYDVNIAPNATVRIDTTPGGSNNFNGLTVGEGATLTHTPMGYNPSNSALMTGGYVNEKDYFAVRWTGWIYVPVSGIYTFYLTSDDGSEMYLDFNTGEGSDNNLTKIPFVDWRGRPADPWSGHSATVYTGMINNLTSGMHRIVLNYFDDNSIAVIRFEWQRPGQQSKEIVPASNLYADRPEMVPGGGLGLLGDYYKWQRRVDNYQDYSIFKIKNYRYSRLDSTINFDWDYGPPFINLQNGQINTASIEDRNGDSYPGGYSKMIIKSNSVHLNQNSRISADGAGFPGGIPISNMGARGVQGYGPGGGEAFNGGAGGGGSYCGRGQRGGPTYGDEQANRPDTAIPTSLGSGGGGGEWNDFKTGGPGGGFISIDTKDLIMGGGSRISSEGIRGNAAENSGDAGNGSGGTVYLRISNSFIQGSNSSVSVNGGHAEGPDGGAGRVAIYYSTGGSIPQNVSANGYNAGNCTIVLSEIGAPSQIINNLSITKMISPATAQPRSTITVILTVYNPTSSTQIVNIKDSKFSGWDTYPANDLKTSLNVQLGKGVSMADGDVSADANYIYFKNVSVSQLKEGLPGIITYTVTVPDNP